MIVFPNNSYKISFRFPTFCFTGHRPKDLGGYDETKSPIPEVKSWLRKHIESIIDTYKHQIFITGGALGVDTWAAEIVQELCLESHVLAIPFIGFTKKWPEQSRKRSQQIADNAPIVVVCSSKSDLSAYHPRNHWMIDRSREVLAVYNGNPKGGTAAAVKYAKTLKLPCRFFNPSNLETGEFKPVLV